MNPSQIKQRSLKAGLPPGTPVHIGTRLSEHARVTVFHYDSEHWEEREIQRGEECRQYLNKPGVTWINVDSVHEVDLMTDIGKVFDLHPLMLEDILNTDQRPKLEDYGDKLYVVLKMMSIKPETKELCIEQMSLILMNNLVLTFQEREGDEFNPIRQQIRNHSPKIRKMGADYLAYALIDLAVDNYFVVLEDLGDEIETMENQLIEDPSPAVLKELHRVRSEIIYLRKALWPLRELVGGLQRLETGLMQPEIRQLYLRDTYDHTIHIIDTVETFRDLIGGLMDIYLSNLSNRINMQMRVLSIIATLFMPLTFITGVYGMNFTHMPGLHSPWGFPLIMLFMAGVVAFMLRWFRKQDWI
jgi:magnesium transporter